MNERRIRETQIESFRNKLEEEEKSPHTVEKYIRDVRAFAVFAAEREISKELMIEYKKALTDQGYAAGSVNSMLASLRSFLCFTGWTDCCVRSLKVQRQVYCPEEKELSKAEYIRLLDAAKKQPRLELILETICGTGIRISELKYFTVEQVHTGEVVVCCKNKTRTILLPGKLKKKLLTFASGQKIKSGVIFRTRQGKALDRSNIWAAMKKLCKTAGVLASKVFPHNLRKLFARTFYNLDRDISKLADILGHSSIETTRIYIMSSGIEHRRCIERLGLIV